MTCPYCGSTDHSRISGVCPAYFEGVTFRRHRCASCNSQFISRQQSLAVDESAGLRDLVKLIAGIDR